MSRKKKLIIAAALALVLFLLSLMLPYAVSLGVMSAYSGMHRRESIMAEKGIQLEIPGGNATAEKDWYPFVMVFNPGESFGRAAGDSELRLTVLYNFGAFDLRRGCSSIYNVDSEYYSSFYGAYLVTGCDNTKDRSGEKGKAPFGFSHDGAMNVHEAAMVPKYDFQQLVLRDFGLSSSEQIFEWKEENTTKGMYYLGYEGWTRTDASLTVNGTAHKSRGFRRSYLQYGIPAYDVPGNKDFQPVEMKGRIYGRYFEEWDTSVFFYILTPGKKTLEKCDRDILSKSLLR